MSLAAIYNVPTTDIERATWAFSHVAHHRDINNAIFQQTERVMPEYVLDPFNVEDMNLWLYQHQDWHNQQNQALGIAGLDLTEVDWNNHAQLAGWIWAHAQEHLQAAEITGVG